MPGTPHQTHPIPPGLWSCPIPEDEDPGADWPQIPGGAGLGPLDVLGEPPCAAAPLSRELIPSREKLPSFASSLELQ